MLPLKKLQKTVKENTFYDEFALRKIHCRMNGENEWFTS